MKLRDLFPLLALMMIIGACQDEQRERRDDDGIVMREQATNPDETMNQWRDAWNQNNGQTLKDLIADDAVLMVYGEARTNNDIDSWIDDSMSWMDGLETSVEVERREGNIAYEAGTYTAGVREGQAGEGESDREGTYTLIWEYMGDQDNQTTRTNRTNQNNQTTQNNQAAQNNQTSQNNQTTQNNQAVQNTQTTPNDQRTLNNQNRQNNWRIKLLDISPKIDTTMVANRNQTNR